MRLNVHLHSRKQKNLIKALSGERLSTYLNENDNDLEKALGLYIKNIEISAAFLIPLQVLEITIRNSLNETIKSHYDTDDWFDVIPLNNFANQKISSAKQTVNYQQDNPQISHVVAELTFGFWLSLIGSEYHQTLWIPFLNKSFPYARKPRSEIHGHLNHIRKFRNRIAHHEPIFARHLEQDYNSILLALKWIYPDIASWVDSNSKVLDVI